MPTPAPGWSAPPGSCGGLALRRIVCAQDAARLLTPRPRGGRHRTAMPAATLGPTTRGACSRTVLRPADSNTAAFWPSARPSGRCPEISGFGLVRLRALRARLVDGRQVRGILGARRPAGLAPGTSRLNCAGQTDQLSGPWLCTGLRRGARRRSPAAAAGRAADRADGVARAAVVGR